MRSKQLLLAGTFCLSAVFSGNLSAKEEPDHDEHEMEQHGSHEHGAARLTVAVTDTGLEIALESPAANIFGFEHNAGDDEEQHVVHEAVHTLRAGNELFIADEAAGCKMEKITLESTIVAQHVQAKHGGEGLDEHGSYVYTGSGDQEEHDHDKHEDHEKEEHDHDKHEDHEKEEHDHDKHEDHDEHKEDGHDHEEHDHDHEGEGTHSDVDVTWNFKCEQPEQLTQMETGIFAAFPKGFERLNVEWINKDAAGAVELEADGTVKFSQ
ncbi:MAG: DUF2796 domain-containing protein [Thiolinea sp.]